MIFPSDLIWRPLTKNLVDTYLASTSLRLYFFKVASIVAQEPQNPDSTFQEFEVCPRQFPRRSPLNESIQKSSGNHTLLGRLCYFHPFRSLAKGSIIPILSWLQIRKYESTLIRITITSGGGTDRYHSYGDRHEGSYSDTKSPTYRRLARDPI